MKLKELKKLLAKVDNYRTQYLCSYGAVFNVSRNNYHNAVYLAYDTILREYYPFMTEVHKDDPDDLYNVLLPLLKTQIKIAELKKMIKKINHLYDLGVHGSAHLYHHPDAEIDEACEWENIYRKIFSEKISKKVHKMVHLDYYDPDTSYHEDVQAFVNAAIPALQNEIVKLKEQSNDRN